MKEDAESYVQTCLVCQQDKIEHKKPGGELDPLPILTRPFLREQWFFVQIRPKSGDYGRMFFGSKQSNSSQEKKDSVDDRFIG